MLKDIKIKKSGKIIQRGTGYCVGEIDGEDLFIRREFFTDDILDAKISWNPDEDYTYLIIIMDGQNHKSLTIKNNIHDTRDAVRQAIRNNPSYRISIIELSGSFTINAFLEPFVEEISLKYQGV